MVTCWACWPASGSAVGLEELSCAAPGLPSPARTSGDDGDGELDAGAGVLSLWPPLGSTCTWTGGCVGEGAGAGCAGVMS